MVDTVLPLSAPDSAGFFGRGELRLVSGYMELISAEFS